MAHDSHKQSPGDARQDHRRMLGFLAGNAACGAALGAGTAILLIWLDIGGLSGLLGHAAHPFIALAMLAFPMALLFGASAAASAVILMPYDEPAPPEA